MARRDRRARLRRHGRRHSPGGRRRRHHPGCVVANNVVFVVDDSGSMAGTDPATPPLRVQAMQLEIKRGSSDGKTFAAIEFGSADEFSTPPTPASDVLFPPELVKPNRSAMLASLSKVNADNGSTDYNAAFDAANTADPTAQARIFMTDGGHNVGDYNNTHLGGGKPKTYVIGFGDSGALPDDAARLQQIANDTGGQYFAQTSSAKLVSVMNSDRQPDQLPDRYGDGNDQRRLHQGEPGEDACGHGAEGQQGRGPRDELQPEQQLRHLADRRDAARQGDRQVQPTVTAARSTRPR